MSNPQQNEFIRRLEEASTELKQRRNELVDIINNPQATPQDYNKKHIEIMQSEEKMNDLIKEGLKGLFGV